MFIKKLQRFFDKIKSLFYNYLSKNFSESFITILQIIVLIILSIILCYFIFVAFTEILLLLILLVLIMIYKKL